MLKWFYMLKRSTSPEQDIDPCSLASHTKESFCRIPLTHEERKKQSHPLQINELSWRIFRIMSEFVEGFQFLSETKSEVTFWGGTRVPASSKWYKEAEKLGRMCAKGGYTVITGGGPGIMEAGNKGAMEAGGLSLGFNIQLPMEQSLNKYVTKGLAFHYFFSRKVVMAASSQAYVFFPGGFGTLDEFYEIVTLIETKKMERTPVICMGKEFWGGLFAWMDEVQVKKFKVIDKKDVSIIQVVDSAAEAYEIIKVSEERSFF